MNQITVTPETDPQRIDQFSIRSSPMVQKLVNTIVSQEYEVYVFTQDGSHFVSEVLGLDWKQGLIWIGTPYEKNLAKKCNGQTPYILVSFPDGIKVQFSGMGLVHTQYEGAEAICLEIPTVIVRLQQRNFFRVIADDELNRQISITIPGLPDPENIVDISLAGCGMMLRKHPDLTIGSILKNARLQLPDGNGSIFIDLEVRNLYPLHDTPELVQVGCEMRLVKRTDEHRLQRFLLSTERRQRAARHSVD
jgi:c-di-GMP-binding flagellar brake protein YcgR